MEKCKINQISEFIKKEFNTKEFIPLHEPRFIGNEKKYLNECIDSTFVSSVGKYVDRFEKDFAQFVGSKYAIAAMNGTAALHIGLILCGVSQGDEVITQPLTFVATCNAISYCNAHPVFVDVDLDTMGLSPKSLQTFLESNCEIVNGYCVNKNTGRRIKACVPMHTFGHSCKIDEINNVCKKWNIALLEDSAESLGSYYKGKHTGTFGKLGAFSFNGNKIITSGGGGVIVTDDEQLAIKAKHLTTTAKVPHAYEYVHDSIGYNYRLPNLNAALLVAQLEKLDFFLESKRQLAQDYKEFFNGFDNDVSFVEEPKDSCSNYWLQAVMLKDKVQRDLFLREMNAKGVMCRPIWRLMTELQMFESEQAFDLKNAKYLEERVVNIPSSVRV
ncbi:LegC family aminotransferase [Francisella philomiragia]|uniref:GDP-perosamine synthase n=1 Tax=Francisella philomiragia subsp. philomiragia (strain ATCC 25017 / CCUG 19701 / FSC 153 / O\|nr:LegC family aminotransferase [Francisella philomiragia]AJI47285.1 aminotransferase class I and II family protein [Francisella philomiragia]AJI49186.1 aminotransferase class I and II family protein [Francisella philomiragia]MBK2019699.1 LegC family aminotransferase [Francisella philomiragia]MBK2029504.1 LegC family aminotransferase [Francisella philomiragia]MBK2264030.1 LegC family aminotransferase [Francisella philomiragia]